ncbi:MAG: hypothetical protein AAFX46_05755 [Cyanobacteria bacterium J06636_27]
MGIWESIADTTNASRGFVKELYDELKYSIGEKFRYYNKEQSRLENEIENLKVENDKLKLIVKSMLRKSIEKGIFTQEEIEALCQEIDAEDGRVN